MSDAPHNPSTNRPDPGAQRDRSAQAVPAGTGDSTVEITKKDGRRFVFRYTLGDEPRLLAGLADMARDPASGLDWFDVATLSDQLGQRMRQRLQSVSPNDPNQPKQRKSA